ncbi:MULTISPECIES: ribonuclease III [Tistrella]|uniref:Ribonuclease 3 n=2 Tax=Tistrella TaxID=171436 RepID=A0ABU9YF68_9PROT|nr:ribonuclease 3 [Tistrella bauzanensis]
MIMMDDRKLAATLADCAHVIGHDFKDPMLLEAALTHPSVDGGGRDRGGRLRLNYERLEFLGDRVLGLAVADQLYQRFPGESEGALARRFAALVRRESLARIAEMLGLGQFLRLSRGEDDSGGRRNPANLADACEAVIAALYLDGGFETARAFVERYWAPLMEEDLRPPKDPKTALQEWAQARGLEAPSYTVIGREGPDHAPSFRVRAEVARLGAEEATGASKRIAEQAAALSLLTRAEARGGDDQ